MDAALKPRSLERSAVAAVLPIAVLLSACSAVMPQPSPTFASFRYELAPAVEVLTAGEPQHYEWAPHADPNYTTGAAEVVLCFALFGPWPDVATLKREFAATQAPACPPLGATVTSDSVRTTSTAGTRMKADAPGPSVPGFYDLRQISLYYAGANAGSIIFDRVIEVRAR